MKTNLLFLGLFALVSCGKIATSDQFSIVRKFEPIAISDSDKSTLTTMCAILSQKAVALDSTLGASYSFMLASKDCDESNTGASKQVDVISSKDGTNYIFKTSTTPFRFQYIETNASGIFKEVCSNLSNLTNPYKDTNGNAAWFSFVSSSGDCPAIKGNKCVLFETGVPKSGSFDSYTITVRDWLSIIYDANYANRGFYSYRKQRNKSACTEDKFQEAIAILK
jgi:hypothetical protein